MREGKNLRVTSNHSTHSCVHLLPPLNLNIYPAIVGSWGFCGYPRQGSGAVRVAAEFHRICIFVNLGVVIRVRHLLSSAVFPDARTCGADRDSSLPLSYYCNSRLRPESPS